MENVKKNKVYILGHKNPDTDSICSAISYANLKQQLSTDGTTYIPSRAGLLSEETTDLFPLSRVLILPFPKVR